MVLLCYNHLCEELNNPSTKEIWELVKDLSPAIIGVLSVVASFLIVRITIRASKREVKRTIIQQRLSEFYSPFLDLRNKSNILYSRFQEKYREENPKYSTLQYLLDGNTFTGNDDELLKEILSIGAKCEKLIHDKAGLIDDEDLRTKVLPNLTTHYLILRMAYEGKLIGEKDRFRDLSFPINVDDLIKRKIVELEKELKNLI